MLTNFRVLDGLEPANALHWGTDLPESFSSESILQCVQTLRVEQVQECIAQQLLGPQAEWADVQGFAFSWPLPLDTATANFLSSASASEPVRTTGKTTGPSQKLRLNGQLMISVDQTISVAASSEEVHRITRYQACVEVG